MLHTATVILHTSAVILSLSKGAQLSTSNIILTTKSNCKNFYNPPFDRLRMTACVCRMTALNALFQGCLLHVSALLRLCGKKITLDSIPHPSIPLSIILFLTLPFYAVIVLFPNQVRCLFPAVIILQLHGQYQM